MLRVPPPRFGRAPACALVLLSFSACTTTSGDDAVDPGAGAHNASQDVFFQFEDLDGGASLHVPNAGRLKGSAEAEVANGGWIRAEQGPDGQAVRFPELDTAPDPARAVLVYHSDGDGLDPGDQDFRFGADFVLDHLTQGGSDDGNNLVQRGLSTDRTQYKLQAENGFVSCRLEGDQGLVMVTSRTAIEPQVWYRVTCLREGDQVTLDLETVAGEELDTVTRGVRTGTLTFDPSVPLAMGGKLTAEGDVVRHKADQLNGALDNVFFDVG